MRVGSKLLGYSLKAHKNALPIFQTVRSIQWAAGRTPLGGTYEGSCELQAGLGEPKLCNFGYARGICRHFPEGHATDAVRFSVSEISNNVVRLIWIHEKDHAPVEHGFLEYQRAAGMFVEPAQGVLGAQALVFVENYLRR